MKPPTRKRGTSTPAVAVSNNDGTWSKIEKRQLLAALKRFKADDYKGIAACIPTRSEAQISQMIRKYRLKTDDPLADSQAPIDRWLGLTCDLVRSKGRDLSDVMPQVMTMVAYLEPHHEPTHNTEPNYQRIYLFLASLLKGSPDRTSLSFMDAAVILDLLQNLATELKECNMSEQILFMRQKYLEQKTHANPSCEEGHSQSADYNQAQGQPDGQTLLEGQYKARDIDVGQGQSTARSPGQSHGQGQSEVEDIGQGSVMTSSLRNERQNAGSSNANVSVESSPVVKRKRGRPRNTEVEDEIPKPLSLFTLNPFKIPVNLLRLKKI